MVILVCALIAVGAIGFTLLVRERDIPPAPVENPVLKDLERRRQVLYDNLKDLQFEYHQGKLSDEDYQSLKAGFLYDLAGLMDAIERLQQGKAKPQREAQREEATAAKEKPQPKQAGTTVQTLRCPSCQTENAAANRFCGACGKPLAQ